MGFTKKTWKNRIAEYINRRRLTMEDGSTNLVTVARDEGTISQEGDAFNAANMNDLEDRIQEGFDEINQSLTNKLDASSVDPMFCESIPGRNQVTNFLYVDLDNRNSDINKIHYFGSDNPATTFTNSPYTAGSFYGYRVVRWCSASTTSLHLVTVELHEQYPIPGRVWSNTYDIYNKGWNGWTTSMVRRPSPNKYVDMNQDGGEQVVGYVISKSAHEIVIPKGVIHLSDASIPVRWSVQPMSDAQEMVRAWCATAGTLRFNYVLI